MTAPLLEAFKDQRRDQLLQFRVTASDKQALDELVDALNDRGANVTRSDLFYYWVIQHGLPAARDELGLPPLREGNLKT